jgi:hypothetical protein
MSANTGHCLCGAVVYRGHGERGDIHVCHCADCRRWTGGPFMGVQFSGGVEIADPGAVNWFESSAWAARGSCRACGTALFYRLAAAPQNLIVTAGSLDDANLGAIAEHIFIDSKPTYYDFHGDAPRVTGAEVFARFAPPSGEGQS